MVNWTEVINYDVNTVAEFAAGTISGRKFYNNFKNTEVGGEARKVLRKYGVTYGRRVARKALRRRAML